MPFRLTGQMSTLSIEWGGVQDGAPTWELPVVLTGKVSHGARETARTVDLAALEDSVDQLQTLRTSATYNVDLRVGQAGFIGAGKIGHYLRVTVKPLSTLVTPEVYVGVVTGRDTDNPDGPTAERFVLSCGANGA